MESQLLSVRQSDCHDRTNQVQLAFPRPVLRRRDWALTPAGTGRTGVAEIGCFFCLFNPRTDGEDLAVGLSHVKVFL